MKKNKYQTTRADFHFEYRPRGQYYVTYESPNTYIRWRKLTHNISLVESVKLEESPRRCDLNMLKAVCKSGEKLGK